MVKYLVNLKFEVSAKDRGQAFSKAFKSASYIQAGVPSKDYMYGTAKEVKVRKHKRKK